MEKSLLLWQKQINGELRTPYGESNLNKNESCKSKSEKSESMLDSSPKSQRSLFEFVTPADESKFPAIFTNNFTEIDLKVFLMQWKIKNGFVLP